MSSPASPCRVKPHRRNKPEYKSPSTLRHSEARMKTFNLLIDNFETLNEFYGMDTSLEQFSIQNFFHKFERMCENGESLWTKTFLDKKRIVWINPMNGFSIAALKDINYEIKLPNAFSTFEENFQNFKSIWMTLEYDVNLLFENIESHISNNEDCCLDCHFPFATICSELYTQFEPDPP